LVSILFLSILQYLQTAPYIKLEHVVIDGVDEGLRNELINMSQLSFDHSLLSIDVGELKRRLEAHPWIRSVRIEKHFPHTLRIQAEKEEPRALVALERIFYMNRWGEIIKELDKNDDVDYPIITGVSQDHRQRKKELKSAAHILDILASEKGPWSLEDLSEIHVNKNGKVSLYSLSLPGVGMLAGGELEMKKEELRRVITHLSNKGIIHLVKRIDLNYKDGAAVSLQKG